MSIEYIDRLGTDSTKWDGMWPKFEKEDLLPLWVADMDFACAPCIKEALIQYIEKYPLGYAVAPDAYYDAFIAWEKENHGYEVKREWICYAPGVVAAFYWAVLMLTRPGDAVITLTPVYYPMLNAATDNDRKLIQCDLVKNGMEYTIDFEKFEEDIVENDVKLFILCSPHNPVGRVWKAEELKQLMDICQKHGVYVISDEIHQDFVWEGHKHVPTATVGDYDKQLITITAASKTFNIAGLKNSLVIIPDDELRVRFKDFANRIHISGGNSLGYIAAAAAYKDGRPWLDEVKAQIWDNYQYIKATFEEKVPEVKVGILEGTYLLWLDFGGIIPASQLKFFLENLCKLALDYGSWFGGEGTDTFARLNLATSRENIEKAVNSIVENIERLR